MKRVPPVMTQPKLLGARDQWTRRCPVKGCEPLYGIQGGQDGLAAHIATVHDGKVPA